MHYYLIFLFTLLITGCSQHNTPQSNGSDAPPSDANPLESSRYTDNGDGTVTDNRTGLFWLKNANCFGEQNWKTAMQSATNLAHGQCELRDGSRRGMWRLPTKEEWEAMLDERPALSNAFSDRQYWYWSSTTHTHYSAWYLDLDVGGVGNIGKADTNYVWAVRGGH
ncbi:hypothetical protein PN36_32965 [Candidatus Thiomargarita nelsonii]|uniref:Lcl C-terminal domain-containing protein n=1 Tax=Candidatus Thiomargarita nelsonii TaxID=1003181 RepID=A0A0A6RN74_9GAMM|nr:hypothetical protein PN36_32965 [Candidatus Thiomargarita nelsonii]